MAARQPDAPAIICPWGRRGGRLTYRQLEDRTNHIARGLESIGIGRGVRTVLMVPPGLDLFALAFALFKAGAVPVLVDPGYRSQTSQGVSGERPAGEPLSESPKPMQRAWFWGGPATPFGRRSRWGGGGSGAARRSREWRLWELHGRRTRSPRRPRTMWPRSSSLPAAPDRPKGVVYRHRNFTAQVDAIREAFSIEPGEVNLPTFPLFALFDPALGMTTVVPDMDPTRPARVDPAKIIEPIREFGVTTMFGSPALLDTVGRWGAESRRHAADAEAGDFRRRPGFAEGDRKRFSRC